MYSSTTSTSERTHLHMLRTIRNHSTLLLFLLAGSIAFFYWLNLRGGHNWGDDFSLYILHAQNIVNGTSYADTGYLYNQDLPDFSPQAYPPVFPLMLAPLIAMFGIQLTMLKLVGLICFTVFLVIFARMVADLDLPLPGKLLLVFAFGLLPLFWVMTDNILSDIPFLVINTLALLQIQELICPSRSFLVQDKKSYRGDAKQILLVGGLIYLAYGTRTIGIVLLPVLFFLDMIKNRRIRKSTVGAAAVAVLMIAVQALLIPGTGSYLNTFESPLPLRDQINHTIDFFWTYYDSFSFIFPFRERLLRHLLFDIALVFALIGYLRRLKMNISVFEIFVPAYLGIVLIWPAYQGMRLLIPVIPFFLIYAYEGAFFLLNALEYRKPLQMSAWFGLLIILLLSYRDGRKSPMFQRVDDIGNPQTQQMFAYVRAEIPQDAVIVSYKPRAMHLFTGRAAMIAAIPPVERSVMEQIQAANAQYFAVEWNNPLMNQSDWTEFAEGNPDVFSPVFENARFRIFKIRESVELGK